jgi:hypothetical protein
MQVGGQQTQGLEEVVVGSLGQVMDNLELGLLGWLLLHGTVLAQWMLWGVCQLWGIIWPLGRTFCHLLWLQQQWLVLLQHRLLVVNQ